MCNHDYVEQEDEGEYNQKGECRQCGEPMIRPNPNYNWVMMA